MVSIIVPAYNAEQYLEQTISSILSQSETDWELLLIDDGSSDSTPDLCRKYAADDPRIQVYHQANAGPSAARNFGISLAQGEYLTFLDADDILHPDFLKVTLQASRESNAGIVATSFYNFYQDEEIRHRPIPSSLQSTTLGSDHALQALFYQKKLDGIGTFLDTSAWDKLFRRDIWVGEDAPKFREGIRYEDLDVIYRAIIRAGGVTCLPYKMMGYRQHRQSFIHTFSEARLDVLDVTDRIVTDLADMSRDVIKAAKTRRFAAHYNILNLLYRSLRQDPTTEERCLKVIRENRGDVLCNRQARLQDRAGALLAYFGKYAIKLMARITSI
ncbi:MAG: glycosyltransferase family 2 protein [Lepagella sp.]